MRLAGRARLAAGEVALHREPAGRRAAAERLRAPDLAAAVGGELGGRTGIAPRLFLKKLVSDVLDRVDLFEDFNPRRDYHLTVNADELTSAEREAHARTNRAPAGSVDEIELDL